MFLIIEMRLLVFVIAIMWLIYRIIRTIIKKPKLNKQFFDKEILNILFLAYGVFVIGLTLLPIKIRIAAGSNPEYMYKPILNFNPFNSPVFNDEIGFKNIIGNFVLLSPLAVFLPMIGCPKFEKIKPLFILAFTISFSIEMLQYLEGYFNIAADFRISDVMDIVLNVSGIFIGKYIYNNLFKKNTH